MSGANWKSVQLRVFDALRDHAMRCPLCMGPGMSLPAGTVMVSSNCETGIVLLTEWFLAKKYAEREAGPERARDGAVPCRLLRP